MENVYIWYLTDNEAGKDVARRIMNLGLNVKSVTIKKLKKEIFAESMINIFIFDYLNMDFSQIFSFIEDDQRLQNYLKFVILHKRRINKAINLSAGILHIEFLSRPVNAREFILLLEKTVIVEQYREIMKYFSKEFETRINSYENLMDINRKDILLSEEEKAGFKNILDFEKNLLKKQSDLNKIVRDYSLLRHKEIFY